MGREWRPRFFGFYLSLDSLWRCIYSIIIRVVDFFSFDFIRGVLVFSSMTSEMMIYAFFIPSAIPHRFEEIAPPILSRVLASVPWRRF